MGLACFALMSESLASAGSTPLLAQSRWYGEGSKILCAIAKIYQR